MGAPMSPITADMVELMYEALLRVRREPGRFDRMVAIRSAQDGLDKAESERHLAQGLEVLLGPTESTR